MIRKASPGKVNYTSQVWDYLDEHKKASLREVRKALPHINYDAVAKALSRFRARERKLAAKKPPTKGRYNRATGWTIVDADEPLTLEITQDHVKKAECKDPAKCVIAQALRDHYGEILDGFQVGASITKIYAGMKVIRYSTPGNLAASLKHFDRTKNWSLPAGKYVLHAISASKRKWLRNNKWEKKKNKKGETKGAQCNFKGTPVAPTRHAPTIYQLQVGS